MAKNKVAFQTVEEAESQIKEFQLQIDHRTSDYTVELLLNKFKNGDFYIPDYQRQYIWRPKNKSLFVESVLLGLPIPFMFFAECADGRYEIIDGAQRIQTLNEFVNGTLKLKDLKKLDKLNGFRFNSLSEATQRKFKNRTFRVIILEEKTTAEARQDLFNRINTTGVKANDSEVRRGSVAGKLKSFIEECCLNRDFIELCPVNAHQAARQERFELVLRFFAYLYNYRAFKHSVNGFLDEFLTSNLNSFDETQYKADFENMLAFVKKNFEYGFAKSKNATVTPRVRFEAIAVGTALALKEKPDLCVRSVDWINSDEFYTHTTSDASNNQKKLYGRIEYVRDQLLASAQ